jgi:hypothetical protein
MDEQRKYAILFSATILAALKLSEVCDDLSLAWEACITNTALKSSLPSNSKGSSIPCKPETQVRAQPENSTTTPCLTIPEIVFFPPRYLAWIAL